MWGNGGVGDERGEWSRALGLMSGDMGNDSRKAQWNHLKHLLDIKIFNLRISYVLFNVSFSSFESL